MNKFLAIIALTSFTTFGAIKTFNHGSLIKSDELNNNFEEIKTLFNIKGVNITFAEFSAGSVISKSSLEVELSKVRNLGLTISELPSHNLINSSDINNMFTQLKDAPGLMPSGIIASSGVRTYYDGTYATSCKEYKNKNLHRYTYSGNVGSGMYRVKPDAGSTIDVYCDMIVDGGGWTLYYSQQTGAYVNMLAKNSSVVTMSASGAHSQIGRIFAVSNETRWTDMSLVKFMQFSIFDSQTSTTAAPLTGLITSQETKKCNVGDPTLWMKFSNGYLNTGTNARKIESCHINGPGQETYFGFRNNMPFAQIKDVVNNATTHECWRDENVADRVFLRTSDPLQAGGCGQFNYAYTSASDRGGSMNYLMWAR